MPTRTLVRIALALITSTALWGCGSPAAPTPAGYCIGDFTIVLTRDDGSTRGDDASK
jgi:hypothetical protein